jgi:hypothetical protein
MQRIQFPCSFVAFIAIATFQIWSLVLWMVALEEEIDVIAMVVLHGGLLHLLYKSVDRIHNYNSTTEITTEIIGHYPRHRIHGG